MNIQSSTRTMITVKQVPHVVTAIDRICAILPQSIELMTRIGMLVPVHGHEVT
jgi:hypothetical protein